MVFVLFFLVIENNNKVRFVGILLDRNIIDIVKDIGFYFILKC